MGVLLFTLFTVLSHRSLCVMHTPTNFSTSSREIGCPRCDGHDGLLTRNSGNRGPRIPGTCATFSIQDGILCTMKGPFRPSRRQAPTIHIQREASKEKIN